MVCCTSKPRVKEFPAGPKAAPVEPQKPQQARATEENVIELHVAAEAETEQQLEAAYNSINLDEGLKGSEYAAMCRELMSMVSHLRDVGANAVLDLPQVIVAGNQSAGKSSLLEALCGIKLPRSDGTCTRCPMEVSMRPCDPNSQESDWSATVRVRREWDAYGMRLPAPELTLIRSGLSPHQVEQAVLAAQDMLLAIDRPSDAGDQEAPVERVAFSRNTVVVDIVGAPLALSLVDLPGIIHATEYRPGMPSSDYPSLILSLTREYAMRPSSVIVAVVSCKEDLDTQGILSLAREVDPEGHRTLGVLTKPDTIEEGCMASWTAIMQGKRWPLKLGWHAVKNPTQIQLHNGISHEAARVMEMRFFASSVWAHTPGSYTQTPPGARLGTVRLRHALARLLSDLTASAVPRMLEDAQRQLSDVDKALSSIPPPLLPASWAASGRPPVDTEQLLRRTMATLMDDVCSSVATLMTLHGGPAVPASWQQQSPAQSALNASPANGAVPNAMAVTGAPVNPVRVFWSGLLDVFRGFRAAVFAARPSYDLNGVVFSCDSGEGEMMSEGEGLSHMSEGGEATPRQQGNNVSMTLEDVWQLMESHRGMELPGFSPYAAVQALVTRSTVGWPAAADQALAAATGRVREGVMGVLQERLGRFPSALRVARTTAHALVTEMATEAERQVRNLVSMECAAAFTMNRTEFEAHCNATLQQLRDTVAAGIPARRAMALHSAPPSFATGPASDHVLSLVAGSLTYFTIAARRVTDMVPMIILHNLVTRCGAELKTVLAAELLAAQGGTAALSQLLAEDPSVAMQRASLQQQRDMLQEAVRLLQSLEPANA